MSLIDTLYSTVSIVVVLAYLPQIRTLLKTKTDCRDISLWAWMMWNYTAIVSMLYSIFVLYDPKFLLVNILNALCINAVIALVLYKRARFPK